MCRCNATALLLVVILASEATAQDRENTEDSAKPSQEASETEATGERSTQRLDFGIDFYDSAGGSVVRGGLDYNWAPLADHSFAATLPVIDSRLSDVEGSGIGDLLLRYNWVPALTLTADPWVPNSLGIGAQLQYMKSFAEGELAQGAETISLSVDLIHVTRSKFWVQYTSAASYDFEAEQYEFDNLLVLGQQFTRRVALRFELRTLNIADPQDATGDGRELDYRATLKLQWILAY